MNTDQPGADTPAVVVEFEHAVTGVEELNDLIRQMGEKAKELTTLANKVANHKINITPVDDTPTLERIDLGTVAGPIAVGEQTEVLQSAFIELSKDVIVTMLPTSSVKQNGYATVDEATAVFRKMAEAMQAQNTNGQATKLTCFMHLTK